MDRGSYQHQEREDGEISIHLFLSTQERKEFHSTQSLPESGMGETLQ